MRVRIHCRLGVIVVLMRRLSCLIVIVLMLAAAGCGPVPEEITEQVGTSEQAEVVESGQPALESASPADPDDFSYLAGTWRVTATLTDIDRPAMQERAEIPQQQWECHLDGATMTIVTDAHTYVGTIEPAIGHGWVFTGTAELTDEDGVSWTNRLTLEGVPAGDEIAGTMELAVDSESLGHSYTADWDFEGERK